MTSFDIRPSFYISVSVMMVSDACVEKVTQKMSFLYTAGAKYVSFDNQTLDPKAFVPSWTKSIAISHVFA